MIPLASPHFEELYGRFWHRLVRYLERIVGSEAEDVAQEAFIKANRSLASFRGDSDVSTWLIRIVTNTAIDHLRRNKGNADKARDLARVGDGEEDPRAIEPAGDSVEHRVIRREMRGCIRGAVRSLPPTYRVVLALSDLEGFRDAEIAAVLGTSVGAAKIRLHRARRRLKAVLERQCELFRDERDELQCDRRPPATRD